MKYSLLALLLLSSLALGQTKYEIPFASSENYASVSNTIDARIGASFGIGASPGRATSFRSVIIYTL